MRGAGTQLSLHKIADFTKNSRICVYAKLRMSLLAQLSRNTHNAVFRVNSHLFQRLRHAAPHTAVGPLTHVSGAQPTFLTCWCEI